MPEMTGMEFSERSSAAGPSFARRVVFVTGGVFTSDAASFLERSGQPQLDKPFSSKAVRAALRKMTAAE